MSYNMLYYVNYTMFEWILPTIQAKQEHSENICHWKSLNTSPLPLLAQLSFLFIRKDKEFYLALLHLAVNRSRLLPTLQFTPFPLIPFQFSTSPLLCIGAHCDQMRMSALWLETCNICFKDILPILKITARTGLKTLSVQRWGLWASVNIGLKCTVLQQYIRYCVSLIFYNLVSFPPELKGVRLWTFLCTEMQVGSWKKSLLIISTKKAYILSLLNGEKAYWINLRVF